MRAAQACQAGRKLVSRPNSKSAFDLIVTNDDNRPPSAFFALAATRHALHNYNIYLRSVISWLRLLLFYRRNSTLAASDGAGNDAT